MPFFNLSKFGEGAYITTLLLFLAGCILVITVLKGDSGTLAAMVTGIMSLLSGICGYWFGTRGKTGAVN